MIPLPEAQFVLQLPPKTCWPSARQSKSLAPVMGKLALKAPSLLSFFESL